MGIAVKRIYSAAASEDGYRVLVDGMWPRGVAKADARLDDWYKHLAPSKALRQWFGHDPERWHEFCNAYRSELDACDAKAFATLREHANDEGLTLVFAARETQYNHAVVLKAVLEENDGQ